jgi:hypothetical protein
MPGGAATALSARPPFPYNISFIISHRRRTPGTHAVRREESETSSRRLPFRMTILLGKGSRADRVANPTAILISWPDWGGFKPSPRAAKEFSSARSKGF